MIKKTIAHFMPFMAALLLITYAAKANSDIIENEDPSLLLMEVTNNLLNNLKENGESMKQDPAKLYAFVQSEILPYVDIDYTSQSVLGRNWKKATDAQKQEFKEAFKTFMMNTYASGLFAYDDQGMEFGEARYNDDRSKAIVPASLILPENDLDIEFKLISRDEGWKLYNVVVADLNMVINFRTDYNNIISQKGLDGLIADLQAKNASVLENR